MDGIFSTGTEVELTRAWGVYASYDHVWVPGKWRTSIYSSYVAVDYNAPATALISAATCGTQGSNAVGAFPGGGAAGANLAPQGSITAISNCDPDCQVWSIGTRTQYNFTPEFYMGIDVNYTKLFTGFAGTGVFRALAGQARPTGHLHHRGSGQRGGHVPRAPRLQALIGQAVSTT